MTVFDELFTAENVYKAVLQNHATFTYMMGEEDVVIADCFTNPELIFARERVEAGLKVLDYFDTDLTDKQRNMRETLKMNYRGIHEYSPEGVQDNES